jgi:hypothetical protein
LLLALCAAGILPVVADEVAIAAPPAPSDALPGEPAHLLSISPLGGAWDDDLVAVAIAPDYTVLLAGNTVDLAVPGVPVTLFGPAGTIQDAPAADPKKRDQPHPSAHGFIVRTSSDGRHVLSESHFGYGMATIERMHLDAHGGIYISGNAAVGGMPGGTPGAAGRFIAKLSPDATAITWTLLIDKLSDFAVDDNGDVVALAGAAMTRYASTDGKALWTATWSSHGDNRPGAMTLAPGSGIAVVVGYGMTKTGHEPYKDPYAHAFDREGRPLWSIWNPEPTLECDAKYGGNGLMADTTGHAAGATVDGKILLMLYADGGNTVCMRDPTDPAKPLAPDVMAGVFQNGAGYGFHGASKTSVIVRIDAATGRIEKGTWMSAWLTPAHANGLSIDGACGDGHGGVLVIGNSASGCPLKNPWYPYVDGTYKGGGFLALFDADFKMRQCGYFAHARMTTVATRGDYAVIGGSVEEGDGKEMDKDPVKVYKPVQATIGGRRDAYFAVFHIDH